MLENKENVSYDISMSVFFNVLNIYCVPFIFQFACPVIAIRDRFNLIFAKQYSKKFEINVSLEIYEMLFQCIDLINSNLTFQLIYMFGFMLVSIIFEIHTVLVVFHQQSQTKFLVLIPNVLWMLLYLHLWIIVIHSSVSAMNSFSQIGSIEYKILRDMKSLEPAASQYIKAYLRHIRGLRKNFETIFFDIDWRLLFGVIEGVFKHF